MNLHTLIRPILAASCIWCSLLLSQEVQAQASHWIQYLDSNLTTCYGTICPTTTDVAYCKGGRVKVVGQHFFDAPSGYTFADFRVYLDSVVPGPGITHSVIGTMPNNSSIEFNLPNGIMPDHSSKVFIRKQVQNDTNVLDLITEIDSVTIYILGGSVDLHYANLDYCHGDTSAVPNTLISLGSESSNFNLSHLPVLPDGRITMDSVGQNIPIIYASTDSICPDADTVYVNVWPTGSAGFTYNNSLSPTICQSAFGSIFPDTGRIPADGHFATSSSGLVISDSATGEIDIAASQAGQHELVYIPHVPCYDTARLTFSIVPAATADIRYQPLGGRSNVSICQPHQAITPTFSSGSSGGQFWSPGTGLVLDSLGGIDVIASTPASTGPGYQIYYLPPDTCTDTVLVLDSLYILPDNPAAFSLPQTSYCFGDTIVPDSGWVPNSGRLQLLQNNSFLFETTGFGLVLDSITAPSIAQVYEVRHLSSGACPDTASQYVTIHPLDVAGFHYSDTTFCTNGGLELPSTLGPRGSFFCGQSGLAMDSLSGQLDLQNCLPGSYQVEHTSGGACPQTDSVLVQIDSSVTAYVSYPASRFCSVADSVSRDSLKPFGGIFRSEPLGMALNPLSGSFDPGSSTPGEYQLIYETQGACQSTYRHSIEILEQDSLTHFTGIASAYCISEENPVPEIHGDTLGNFGGTTGLDIFPNGKIDLSSGREGEFYTIYYAPDKDCADTSFVEFQILETDDPSFRYPITELCQRDTVLDCEPPATAGGIFSANSPGLVIHPSSGQIDVGQSEANQNFSYYQAKYQTSGTCPATDSVAIRIRPNAEGGSLSITPRERICKGAQATFTANVNAVAESEQISWFHNGVLVSAEGESYADSNFADKDYIEALVTNASGCQDTVRKYIEVREPPKVNIISYPRTILFSDRLEILAETSVDETRFEWTIQGLGRIDTLMLAGIQTGIDSGWPQPIGDELRLEPHLEALQAMILVRPYANGCYGEPDSVVFDIIPDKIGIFIPEVFTPNDDGFNDAWHIRWRDNIDPTEFTMQIFNGSGGLVYEMPQLHQNWSGDRLPDGVYWWIMRNRAGNTVRSGGLTIRRR